jgi:predicted dehydrogenase
MAKNPLKIALIGFGAFGRFIADALDTSSSVKLVTVVDPAAASLPERGYAITPDLDGVLADKNIEAVHIATPPDTHADLALRVIAAGKHVVIEKPLALTPAAGQDILAAAKQAHRTVALGYILRYNPLLTAVRQLIAVGVLGPVHYFRVDNLAHGVPADHWFWDRKKSGGIHVEHGVHFIDAAAYLLDNDPVDTTGKLYVREGRNTEAVATVRYGETIASFWHGFIASRAELESTEWLIVGENGWVRLAGWIPETATIRVSAHDATQRALAEGGWQITTTGPGVITAQKTLTTDKQSLYAQSVRDLWDNVAGAIRGGPAPRASGQAGLASLTAAWQASQNDRELRL